MKNFSLYYRGEFISKTDIETEQDTSLLDIMKQMNTGETKPYFDISTGHSWKVTKDNE